jgi:2'-5' RNA ligase
VEKKSKYFIAILPSQEVSDRVQEIKHVFRDKYNCTVASRSPAHITLQPPFSIFESEEKNYIDKLYRFSATRDGFEIDLKNFAAFAPRTVYIDVVPNNALFRLQKELIQFLQREGLIAANQMEERPFKAHVTVANRDLKPKDFKSAWQIYRSEPFEATFEVASISLLKHNGAKWDIHESFTFLNHTDLQQ